MISRRRALALSSLILGVGLTIWICLTYNVFGALGLASLVGGGVIVVFIPATLGVLVCIVLLLMDEEQRARENDSTPTPRGPSEPPR